MRTTFCGIPLHLGGVPLLFILMYQELKYWVKSNLATSKDKDKLDYMINV